MTEDESLEAARAACGQHRWAAAREEFRAAGELGTEDLGLLVDTCWWLGEVDEYAAASAELHRRLLAEERPVEAALVAFELGYTEVVRGRAEVGIGWMARARRLFAEVPEAPERGLLLAADAQGALSSGDLRAAGRLAREALALGEEHGLATVVALSRFLCGCVAVHEGRTEQGLRDVDEAMLPVQAGEVAPEWVGLLYCDTMSLCFELRDLPRAQRWTTLTERWCEGHTPAVLFTGICRVHRAQLRMVHGEWDRAEEEARQAATDLEPLDVGVAGEAHYCLGELHRLRGDLAAADAAYRRAHELGRDPLPGLALLCLPRGRRQVAASVLDAALAAQTRPLLRAPLLAARVEVCLAGDDLRGATAHLDELSRTADAHASPGWQAEALRWRGALLLVRDRPAEAVRALRESQVRWRRMDAPYQVCRIGLDLAVAYEALGDRDTARRERDAAAAVLERLGVTDGLDGSAPDRAGLTPRELEVVAAVADGSSNRQVAGALHISERTVARHLANVYVKTGVASRTGAVTWARDHGLL
ncbi:LuxR C-terminal-related transcriptional regulator [Ornithinimicrobium sp. W1679]|uniref:LuxR C-terminal-related transcriptional regulator n=1 Tax=Ornithinimicrobium sp. W1679 TaxID=3418770 RepID=UPI003CE79FEC